MQIVVCDKALDLVNGDCLVNACAGALGLALLVADASADGGEGVLLLYKLKRLGVASLSGELEVALNGNVSRAGGLAGRGAGVEGVLEVLAVIGIEGLFDENGVGELRVARRREVGRGAQLLAELERIAGAGLDALCARNALCLVYLGDEVRAYRISRAEHQSRAQSEAGAGAAVADSGAVACLLDVGDIVHQTVFLGALDDLKRLLAAYLTRTARAYVVLGALAHLDAHILVKVTAAVAYARARGAAGAGGNGENIVLIKIVGKALIVVYAGYALKGALDGDDAHKTVAVGKHGTERLHTQAGVFLKGAADLGVGCHELLVVYHHLKDAGREYLHEIDILPALLVEGAAEKPVVNEIVQRGLYLVHGLADLLGEIFGGAFLAQSCGDGDVRLVVGNDVRHAVVLRCILVYLDDRAGNSADDLGELDDLGSEICHS